MHYYCLGGRFTKIAHMEQLSAYKHSGFCSPWILYVINTTGGAGILESGRDQG